jgi:C1A family cysteine protease
MAVAKKKVGKRSIGKSTARKSTAIKSSYGWLPDFPDQRDYSYRALRPVARELPPIIDLRPQCSPIEDQGNLGSCTANALAGALEFLENKDGVKFVDTSRLFIYYNERVIEHSVKQDSGAMIRDGIKTLAKQGVCTETKWPYSIGKFDKKPTATCYKEGLKRRIKQYARIEALDEMRTCLADGFPFVFGFSVYDGFESAQVAKSGVLNMPDKKEKLIGGHAVVAVGYDDSQQRFLVRNSWGSNWGLHGYFTMPYAYLENRNLSDDIWTIRRGTAM